MCVSVCISPGDRFWGFDHFVITAQQTLLSPATQCDSYEFPAPESGRADMRQSSKQPSQVLKARNTSINARSDGGTEIQFQDQQTARLSSLPLTIPFHYPRRRNMITSMVGSINGHIRKNLTKEMVKPTDIAGNAEGEEKEEEEEEGGG